MQTRIWSGWVVVGLLAMSCSGPEGRVMEDAEEDIVGNRAAGAETFDRLIEGAVQKLLLEHSAASTGVKHQIAVLEVENASAEELTDWQEQIYDKLDTSINQSERYVTISRRFVDEALRETRLRPDNLFLPKYRRDFIAVLEQSGNPVELLLFPKLSSGTTRGGDDTTQRNYLLTLELVDVDSGKSETFSQPVRKQYQR